MNDQLKQKLIAGLAVTNVLLLVIVAGSCSGSHRQKLAKDKELYARIELEEKLNKMMQEKNALEVKVKDSDNVLSEEKKAHEATNKLLAQERLITQSLKAELAKLVNTTALERTKLAPIPEKTLQ